MKADSRTQWESNFRRRRRPSSVRDYRTGIYRLLALALLLCVPSPAAAQRVRGVLDDFVRGVAKVPDDIPIKKVDELVTELSKSRTVRDAVDAELKGAGRAVVAGEAARGVARSDDVLRLLRSATSDIDPSVIRRIEQLDEASRDVALVLAKGGQELARTLPDLSTRGRLLREGGAETVAAAGLFGPDAVRAAMRLDEAIRGGTVFVKDGMRAVTVADFGAAMTRNGDASWSFWKRHVQPHWKVWAASGALAAYLANPQAFQNAVGEMTEQGFKRLTEFAGEAAAAAIRGIGEGTGKAVENLDDAVRDTFFTGEKRWYAVTGSLIFLSGLMLAFGRVRYWLLRPFRWLNQSPKSVDKPGI